MRRISLYLTNKWLLHLFGIFLFVFILSRIDLEETLKILSNTDLVYLSAALILIVPLILTKACRWQFLMRIQDINYSLRDSFLMYSTGMFIGIITPGKLGDFIKILYLQKDGHSFGKSFVSVFIDRLFDLVSLLFIGYISLLVFISLFEEQIIILSIFFIITALIFLLLVYKKGFNKKILRRFYILLVPEKYKTNIRINFNDFYRDLHLLSRYGLLLVAIATIIGWIIYFAMTYLLMLSLGIAVPVLYLISCVSISSVISLIPISISGIGTRDAIFIVLFSHIGLSKESAIAFSILILLAYTVTAGVGLCTWFKKPIDKIFA